MIKTNSNISFNIPGRGDDSLPEERPFFLHALRDVTTEEGTPLIIGAPFAGNPIPDVCWSKDGIPIVPSDRVTMSCDGKRVNIQKKYNSYREISYLSTHYNNSLLSMLRVFFK